MFIRIFVCYMPWPALITLSVYAGSNTCIHYLLYVCSFIVYVVRCNALPYACIVCVHMRLCLYVYVSCMLVACYMLAVYDRLLYYDLRTLSYILCCALPAVSGQLPILSLIINYYQPYLVTQLLLSFSIGPQRALGYSELGCISVFYLLYLVSLGLFIYVHWWRYLFGRTRIGPGGNFIWDVRQVA